MKKLSLSPTPRAALCALSVLGLGAGASLLPAFTPPAQAAPKRVLELWPGQRVLLVLPLTIGPDWNGGPELAEAVKPLVRPALQRALSDTNKFSLTLPYRFDPILRRAVTENRISQDIITPFEESPSLATAQPVFSQLQFEQVPMATQVQLEELRVGGTPKKPTLQMQVSAQLYEIGGSGPFRSVVVTSNPAEGRTPEARLQNAAADAFRQIAAFFVKAPETFQLPASLEVRAEDATDKATGDDAAMNSANGAKPAPAAPVVPAPKAMVPSTQPNGMTSGVGASAIPRLPVGEPPLGVEPGTEKALGR